MSTFEETEKERLALHGMMYDQAVYRRDVKAARWLLTHCHGYVENSAKEPEKVLTIPGAAPDLETYCAYLGVEPPKVLS